MLILNLVGPNCYDDVELERRQADEPFEAFMELMKRVHQGLTMADSNVDWVKDTLRRMFEPAREAGLLGNDEQSRKWIERVHEDVVDFILGDAEVGGVKMDSDVGVLWMVKTWYAPW